MIYQKRVPEKRPDWVESARVTFPSGRHADELCVTEVAQVAWAANLAVVDFHPWPSRRSDVDKPDELRIDIDPAARDDLRGRQGCRGGRARDARRDGVDGLAEDIREPWHPRRLQDRAELGLPGRAPLCARVRARDRAAAAEEGDDRVVEGAAWQARLHRLQPERPRPHDRVGVLGARAARCDRLGTCHLGRVAGRRDGGLHARDDAEALREARRRPGRDRRGGLRPERPARVGRARGSRRRGRGAVPAAVPEDAWRAQARAALARQEDD